MIRLATIGTSMITGEFAAAVKQVDGIEVTVVHSRDAAKGEAFAAKIGAPAVSTDMAAMLGSSEIDAVYVASPNSVHASQARDALRAGKHVIVEKPAVQSAAEWIELTALAKAQGVVLMEAMRSSYDPSFETIRELMGTLGPIRGATLRLQQRSSRYDDLLEGRVTPVFDPAFGGGALSDLGIYCVHAMIQLFGEPTRVLAASVPVSTGADGSGDALCVFDGMVVELSYSKITGSPLPNEIRGEQGRLTFDSINNPAIVQVERRDGTSDERRWDKTEFNLEHEVARFRDLVNGLDSDASDQAASLSALRVMDAIRAAATA